MDNWGTTTAYQMALDRHSEDRRRGDAARQLAQAPARLTLRARLATGLLALAARLDADRSVAGRDPRALTPAA